MIENDLHHFTLPKILLLFLVVFVASCSKNEEKPKSVEIDQFVFDEAILDYEWYGNEDNIFAKTFYISGTDTPYTGLGTMEGVTSAKVVWEFVDGKLVKVQSFNILDELQVSSDYLDGKRQTSRTFFPNGDLKIEWTRESLVTREWFEDGTLKMEINWNEEGLMNGPVKVWDENGEIITDDVYENGVLLNPDLDFNSGSNSES